MSDEWRSEYVALPGLKIHTYRSGGDKPPVVLSHGFTDNGLCWTPLARELSKDYDVIMYDTRGHGLSDSLTAEGDIYKHLAVDLAGLIQKLKLDKARLIGHSLGAATVAAAAANHPDLVRCVVLEDPPWRPPGDEADSEERNAAMQAWRADIVAYQSKSPEDLAAQCRRENPRWSEDECRPWAASKLQLNLSVFQFFATSREPWQDVVRRIACPILLLTADPELGAIITPEIAQEAASIWRDGRAVHLAGAGHNIRREQFDAYVKQVSAFLAQS